MYLINRPRTVLLKRMKRCKIKILTVIAYFKVPLHLSKYLHTFTDFFVSTFPKVSKWAGSNKRAGRIFFQKLINGQALIRMSRVEIFSEINKRACLFIKLVRVL